MGAWGIGPFDNDDAADWMYELEESAGAEAIRSALEAIGPDGDLEAPDCCMALAAAEVVAALNGQAHESLPTELVAWVDENATALDDDLLGLAIVAAERIEAESELKELWEETGDFDAWAATLNDLKERLGAA